MEGMSIKRAPSGFVIITLRHTADPAKRDPAFLEAIRVKMGDKAFRREMLLDWTAPTGASYYAEYEKNGGDAEYVHSAKGASGKRPLILRGWDFGVRKPACVWAQYDPSMRRLWVLREMMPGWWDSRLDSDYGIDIRSFRDSVLFLSGQLPSQALSERAIDLVNRIAESPDYPVPTEHGWFSGNEQFMDFALGREVNRRMETEEQLLTYADILSERGVVVTEANENWDVRETVMRELLTKRSDGWPGLFLDPACRILISGFNGGFQYAKKTKQNSLPEAANRDGYFEHLHDCLNYISVSMLSAVIRPETQAVPTAVLRNTDLRTVVSDGVDYWVGKR
jgi:hypothetical protein